MNAYRPAMLTAVLFTHTALMTPSEGAMPPGMYQDMLAAADTHLQLAITGRDIPATPAPGACRIEGIVVHVFSGAAAIGEEVEVDIPCVAEGTEVPVGGIAYTPAERLASAGFLELVLESGADGSHSLAAQGLVLRIIPSPSREPVIERTGQTDPSAAAARSTVEVRGLDGGQDLAVPCTAGAAVEVGTFGYWAQDATIVGGPDSRGRCLVRVGTLEEGTWYTQHELRSPGSDKALAQQLMVPASIGRIPDGAYLCHLAGTQFLADASFSVEGGSYRTMSSGTEGQVVFDANSQSIEWSGGPFEGIDAVLLQDVSTGKLSITFPPETTQGSWLDYGGNNIHCYLEDGL